MEQKVKKILDDIYMIDEGLKKHEKDLIKIAKKLIESKPDTEFTAEFASELKKEILEKADELKSLELHPTNHQSVFFKFGYMLSGALICAVIIIPLMGKWNSIRLDKDLASSNQISLDENVQEMSNKDFGSLSVEIPSSDSALGRGAGGGGTPAPESMQINSKMISMPAPDRINYQYIYSGGELNDIQDSYQVYKKNKSTGYAKFLGESIQSKDFGLVDIDKFSNLKVANINLTEDKDNGYSIYYNSKEQLASISMNWDKWNREESNLSLGDVPSDDKLIQMAKDFLNNYGIDISSYGKGRVINDWKQYYNDEDNNYVPENIQVIFPLKIEGQIVYDQSGRESGMTVNVNIRNNKVSGVYNIIIPRYESSSYESVNNFKDILGLAKKGGMFRNYNYDDPTETVEVELGGPSIGLVRYWRYNKKELNNEELFIPALLFPIINNPEGRLNYQNYIIVPLVKKVFDILNTEQDNVPPIPELLR